MPEHHKYGGSTATRTLNCGAWTHLSEGKTKGRVGMAASEGTMMHTMFENGMTDPDYDPHHMLGLETVIDGNKVVVTDDMIRKVLDAFDVMDEVLENLDPDDTDIQEYEISGEFNAMVGGTADAVTASRELNCFTIGDLKTGDGHMVYALANDQLLFYTWMMVLKYQKVFDFNEETEFVLYIIQPSERKDDYYDEWVTDLKDVLEWAEKFKRAVKVCETGKADPNPGDWCQYCPAMLTCPAKTGQIVKASRMPSDGAELSELIAALNMVDQIEEWCREVRKVAHDQADQGTVLTGFKLVNKRATRKWKDEDEAFKKLKLARKLKLENYMTLTLKSPAQMEKELKKIKVDFKQYEGMIVKQSSGTTLVKDSDKRPAALPLDGLAGMIASIE